MSSVTTSQDTRLALNWVNAIFMAIAHLLAGLTVVLLIQGEIAWQSTTLAIVYLWLCGIAITAGYHRLFAHASYKASWPWRLVMLLFGAASVQNSAINWSNDHRRHHSYVDQDSDPYNIQKGFWWAHVLWIIFVDPKSYRSRVADLERDKLVVWQHKYYMAIAVVVGVLVPTSLGFLWGDPLGALLAVGFLRLVVQWHITFTVNSVAHMLGSQPYSKKVSARDSWITAILSLGEGYHNFHHSYQNDYRNGVRWWQFDPTKWILWTLSKVGVVSDLRRRWIPKRARP